MALAGPARAELSDNDRVLYREAYAAAKANNWDQVWSIARGATDKFPAKLLLWVELMRGGLEVPFAQYRDFISNNPTWPGLLVMRRHAELALRNQSDAMAAEWFKQFPPLTPAGKTRLADIEIAGGHTADADTLLREVWIDGNFATADETAFLQHYGDAIRPIDHAKRLDRLLWDGRDADARRMLARVSLAQRALGAARIALLNGTPDAEHLFAQVPPQLQNDPGLTFARLKWRRRKDHLDDAIALLDHPPPDLVRPLAWAGERQILARTALNEGKAAIAYRLAAANGLNEGAAFGELEFLAGWIALRHLNNPAEAYQHFVKLYEHSKMAISHARGAYWAARAAAAMHQSKEAADWYEKAAANRTTYYGQLASAAIHDVGTIKVEREPEPAQADIAKFEALELVRAARDLVAMGDGEDARPFLFQLIENAKSPADYVQVARLALALERPDMELTAAKRAVNDGVNLFAENYPLIALPPGGKSEPALVLALTRQESGFDQGAVSPVGARGMMQLMPFTAQKMAKSLSLPYSAGLLTDDRVYNMRLGRAYIDEMLDQFSGSYVLAIAAYNAGPARVGQWIGQFGDPRAKNANVIDWVESIPISETRNYVQRVLENLQIYRFMLGDRAGAFELVADLRR
ncbi:MAG TPA: lytic transglycosylase domain-containing protein [Stellaceae bacterium]|nr:lytic transglycosylase domain-containing protein [Stellaceae bacterium]